MKLIEGVWCLLGLLGLMAHGVGSQSTAQTLNAVLLNVIHPHRVLQGPGRTRGGAPGPLPGLPGMVPPGTGGLVPVEAAQPAACEALFSPESIELLPEGESESFTLALLCLPGEFQVSRSSKRELLQKFENQTKIFCVEINVRIFKTTLPAPVHAESLTLTLTEVSNWRMWDVREF